MLVIRVPPPSKDLICAGLAECGFSLFSASVLSPGLLDYNAKQTYSVNFIFKRFFEKTIYTIIDLCGKYNMEQKQTTLLFACNHMEKDTFSQQWDNTG